MATDKSLLRDNTSTSVYIESNQFQKSANVCKFENCTNLRKGSSDFCRKHKALGRIISGRIAREKAIAKIAERDTEKTTLIEVEEECVEVMKANGGAPHYM